MNSSTSIVSMQEVIDDLLIDEVDEKIKIKISRYINVADSYLIGILGENYPRDDHRAKQLALFIIEDMYDRNSTSLKESSALKRMKDDFIFQLQMEGRIGK